MNMIEIKKHYEHNVTYAENIFLENLIKKQKLVHVYLSGGIKMVGTINGFDDFTILISARSFGMQMIYKHAITTVVAANKEGE